MKKTLIFIMPLFLMLILTGCNKKTNNVQPQENSQAQVQENSDANCFTICHEKIQDACLEEIIEIGPENITGGFFNPNDCERICQAEFADNTLDCFSKITECDQVLEEQPYCKEGEVPDSDVYEVEEVNTRSGCQIPCEKYKKCAGYGSDATADDMAEAYNSCMEVCQDWSDETIACINKKNINTPADCSNLSLCALGEYQGLMR